MFNKVYECVLCHSPLVFDHWIRELDRCGQYTCGRCHTPYEYRDGALNTLINPASEILDLIRTEQTRKPHLELPLYRIHSEVPYKTFEEHRINFEAIVSTVLKPSPGIHGTVLQMGCQETTYPLRWFRTRNYRTFGCCHIMPVTDEMFFQNDDLESPQFAVVDYTNLPYANGTFDYVVVSNLLGHLPGLKPILKEIHRILKPGGSLLIVNEPVKGWFDKGRHAPKYTLKDYAKTFNACGFRSFSLFFPEYLDQLLHLGRVSALRYKKLGQLFRLFWKVPGLRRHFKRNWTLPGHMVLGIPLHVMLYRVQGKPASLLDLWSDLSWPPRLPWDIEPPPDALNNVSSQVTRRGDIGERRTNGRPGTRRSDDREP